MTTTTYNQWHAIFRNSDHKLQLLKLQDDFSIATWNILKQCRFYEGARAFYNNGFGKIETNEEYRIRLKAIVEEIAEVMSQDQSIKCMALQEAPLGDDFEFFASYLKSLLPWIDIKSNESQSFIFDSAFMKVEDLVLRQELSNTKNKLQALTVKTNSGTDFDLINVHLLWKKPHTSAYYQQVNLIKELATKHENTKIVTGDFNMNILNIKDKPFEVFAEVNTSLSYVEGETAKLATCDGFILVQ